MSEADLMREILVALCRIPGGLFWRRNVGVAQIEDRVVRFGMPGQADIEGVVRSRHIEIEVKTRTGRQSAHQRRWQAAIERAGGAYIVARSVDEALAAVAALFPTSHGDE